MDELLNQTPILTAAEQHGWVRLHPLARDFLLGRFEQLPAAEQREAHRRAAVWFATRQRRYEAARHALAAGDLPSAQSHAESCLFDLVKQGLLAEAREWRQCISKETLARDADLRVASAWIMALGDQPAQALDVARALARNPAEPPPIRFEAALVGATAAAFEDRPGIAAALLDGWESPPAALRDPVDALAHANLRALLALFAGRIDDVLRLEAYLPERLDDRSLLMAQSFGRMIVGVTHLWEGNAYKAEEALRMSLADAERRAGRRGVVACMFAPVLAAAMFERDQPAAAQALLANRLDVIERSTLPDAVLLAYQTLARVAMSRGDERHAFEVLDSLASLGEARRMPRLVLVSLAEQLRFHVLRSRRETVRRLATAIGAMRPQFDADDHRPLLSLYQLTAAIADAYVAIGDDEPTRADEVIAAADALASRLNRGRDALTIAVLRAVVARGRRQPQAASMLAEAQGLAAIRGVDRLLADTHPRAVELGLELRASPKTEPRPPAPAAPDVTRPAVSRLAAAPLTGMLTPKEAEVLVLLGSGMSNKLIARTMGVSDETVKWHLKNLFSKLSAGTRKHAVDRARLLGLLAA
jgi:LuxR family maltose regulon positive regulatory protein